MNVKWISAAACILTVFAMASFASAAQFTGTISLNGSDTFTTTTIAFSNPANVGGVSGAFVPLGNCLGCVTMSDFNSSSTNFLVYTASNNGLTTTLTLTAASFSTSTCGSFTCLTITGNGTANLTGYDPTPGQFTLTTQGTPAGATTTMFTFSSTTQVAPVPEPASLLLFGTGLCAAAARLRRRLI